MSKKFRAFVFISLFFIFGCAIWKVFLENIVPRERTSFPSYGSFINITDRLLQHYPKSLPSSAENIRYFHYRGGFDTKTGISEGKPAGDAGTSDGSHRLETRKPVWVCV